jgi:hypothetical protein
VPRITKASSTVHRLRTDCSGWASCRRAEVTMQINGMTVQANNADQFHYAARGSCGSRTSSTKTSIRAGSDDLPDHRRNGRPLSTISLGMTRRCPLQSLSRSVATETA